MHIISTHYLILHRLRASVPRSYLRTGTKTYAPNLGSDSTTTAKLVKANFYLLCHTSYLLIATAYSVIFAPNATSLSLRLAPSPPIQQRKDTKITIFDIDSKSYSFAHEASTTSLHLLFLRTGNKSRRYCSTCVKISKIGIVIPFYPLRLQVLFEFLFDNQTIGVVIVSWFS